MALYDEQIIGAKQQAETARKLREGYKSPEGSMVSGWYVPPSITQNLAELLKVYIGRKREDAANEKLAGILKDKQSAIAKWGSEMPTAKEYAAVPEQVTPTYESGTNQMVANALRGGQEPQQAAPQGGPVQQDPSMLSALIRGEQPQQMPMASVPTPVQTGQTVTPAQPARTEQVTPEQRMQWIMQGSQLDPTMATMGATMMNAQEAREAAKAHAAQTMIDKLDYQQRDIEGRKDTARLVAGLRPAPQEPLVPVKQDDGTVIYLPRSQAVGKAVGGSATEKPLTEFQAKDVGYGTRAQDADKILEEVGSNYSPAKLNTASATENLGVIGWAANSALGPNEQKAGQAQRNFINATLRQESGAAIAPSEFANARKQYFPQVGDSKEVLAQKAANRKRVIDSFKIGAGTQGAKHFDETKDPLGLR